MSGHKVSIRYAASLLDLAVNNKNLDAVSGDMVLVSDTLTGNPQLVRIISSPVVRSNIKLSIIEDIFKSRITSDSLNFLKFIILKNRENLLKNIVKRFLQLKDEYLGIVNVEVKAIVRFTTVQENKLISNMESFLHKKVKVKYIIDNELIGGFIARVGDTVFDASLKHQLDMLRKQFLSGSVSLN